VAYAGLGLLLALSIRAERTERVRQTILALAIAGTYAILDEWHQQWIPTRSGSVGDVVADWTGAFLGIMAIASLGPLEEEHDDKTTPNPADQ
jgi:VanZ family protein